MQTPSRRRSSLAALALAGLWVVAQLAAAGPLNPPAGAIVATGKALAEVEPRTVINALNTPGDADSTFKITAPGSYYLTGNMIVAAGKDGIEVAASGVTIDLGGFLITGTGGLDAITTSGGPERITIRNGHISGTGGGIAMQGLYAISVENITVSGCTSGYGIQVGSASRIVNCTARGNQLGGIASAAGSTIIGCTAHANTGIGFIPGFGNTVSCCAAYNNTGAGFSTNPHASLDNCSAHSNGGAGFAIATACSLSNCTASQNGADGFDGGADCTYIGCSANINAANGFSIGASVLNACAAYDNVEDGFNAVNGTTLTGCTSRANDGDGIEVGGQCVVLNCNCSSNGNNGDGAGIHATGGDNRIEGNNCSSADRGFDIDAAGNILIRNTASGNSTNWDIAANNKCLVVQGVNAPAFSGSAGGAALGSTDPNVNFTY